MKSVVTVGMKPVMIVLFVFELPTLGTSADTMSFFFFLMSERYLGVSWDCNPPSF